MVFRFFFFVLWRQTFFSCSNLQLAEDKSPLLCIVGILNQLGIPVHTLGNRCIWIISPPSVRMLQEGGGEHPPLSLSSIITHLFTASLISLMQLSFHLMFPSKWQKRRVQHNCHSQVFFPTSAVKDTLSIPYALTRMLGQTEINFCKRQIGYVLYTGGLLNS